MKFKKIHKDAITPNYATPGAAGFDLYSVEEVAIKPQETKIIHTGLEIECPEDMAVMVYPRSGISAKTTLRLANGVGVIDSDYRGELLVIMYNAAAPDLHLVPQYQLTDGKKVDAYNHDYVPHGTVVVKKGDRIAQGVLQDITQAEFEEVDDFEGKTKRGKGGLGSTGK